MIVLHRTTPLKAAPNQTSRMKTLPPRSEVWSRAEIPLGHLRESFPPERNPRQRYSHLEKRSSMSESGEESSAGRETVDKPVDLFAATINGVEVCVIEESLSSSILIWNAFV